jgi:hypothetical protein
MKKITQFNNSCTTSLKIKKPPQGTHLLVEGFPMVAKIIFPIPLKQLKN